MDIKINEMPAKSLSYGGKRDLSTVRYIAMHYTGNKGDTARNNAKYFATSNTRQAGAHFFVDKEGDIWNSVPLNRIAWAVGGFYSKSNGGATYYGKCTNANSVSIELCDLASGKPSWKQMVAVKRLVKYIKKKCPNAKTVLRHWDVNGKSCPVTMIGKSNEQWKRLRTYITKGYQFKGTVTRKAALRSSGKVSVKNKIGTRKKGSTVYITKIVGNWGRLKKKTADGKYRWISLKKVKEV